MSNENFSEKNSEEGHEPEKNKLPKNSGDDENIYSNEENLDLSNNEFLENNHAAYEKENVQNSEMSKDEKTDQENLIDENNDNITEVKPKKKLRKSGTNKIISGVCGGLGEYFHIDPALIRLFFLLSLLIGYYGIIIYALLAVILKKEKVTELDYEITKVKQLQKENRKALAGSVVILLGMYTLFEKFGLWNSVTSDSGDEILIPTVISFLIFIVIFEYNIKAKIFLEDKRLMLSRKNRISGVCAGLANYFNIDAALVRILFVVFTFFSFGIGAIAYLIFALALPDTPQNNGNLNAE